MSLYEPEFLRPASREFWLRAWSRDQSVYTFEDIEQVDIYVLIIFRVIRKLILFVIFIHPKMTELSARLRLVSKMNLGLEWNRVGFLKKSDLAKLFGLKKILFFDTEYFG